MRIPVRETERSLEAMMDALPEIGDHLISRRPGFMHHGIYLGSERVIHYGGNSVPGVRAKVEEIPLARFAGTNGYAVVPYKKRWFGREESVRRARTRLGEDLYCAVSNNCQHFVEWCIMGIHKSGQVSARTGVAAGAVVATGTGAAVGAVAAAGAMSGLSGPGIVSGLAAIGAAAGGGVAAGLAFVGAAPALAVTGLLSRTMYRQNPGQPKSERVARRIGSATTVAIGMMSAVTAIGAPSLGAASGGALVGGVVVAAASPAIAAAVAGYGAYRVSRKLLRRVDERPQDALPPP
jgi:hypothetical protein